MKLAAALFILRTAVATSSSAIMEIILSPPHTPGCGRPPTTFDPITIHIDSISPSSNTSAISCLNVDALSLSPLNAHGICADGSPCSFNYTILNWETYSPSATNYSQVFYRQKGENLVLYTFAQAGCPESNGTTSASGTEHKWSCEEEGGGQCNVLPYQVQSIGIRAIGEQERTGQCAVAEQVVSVGVRARISGAGVAIGVIALLIFGLG